MHTINTLAALYMMRNRSSLSNTKIPPSTLIIPVTKGELPAAVATALSAADVQQQFFFAIKDNSSIADILTRIFPEAACLEDNGAQPTATILRAGLLLQGPQHRHHTNTPPASAPPTHEPPAAAHATNTHYIDFTDSRLVMGGFIVTHKQPRPVDVDTLCSVHLPWAKLMDRALVAIHRAAPDFLGVQALPDWLTHEHTLIASDKHPMPLLRVPQVPIRIDDGWIAYVPHQHCAPDCLRDATRKLPPPYRTATKTQNITAKARTIAESGAPAQAVGILDKALQENRHNHDALHLMTTLLERAGEDDALLGALTYHLDANPDDQSARASHTAAMRRKLDGLLAESILDDTNFRPRDFNVSAIVSTYASAEFMEECLTDLEAQTMADCLEIIIVDAASPEDERSTVSAFQKRYDNIRYIRTPERISIYAAWNLAIHMARGRYITPFSTNDRLAPTAYDALSRALQKTPEAFLAFGDTKLTDTPHQTFASHTPTSRFGGAWQWPDYSFEHNLVSCTVGPHPMWRRDVHDMLGFLDDRYPALGDQDFFMRLGRVSPLLHIHEFTGLAWLSPTALSDETKTQHELLAIRHKFRCVHARDMVELAILSKYYETLVSLADTGRSAEALSHLSLTGPRLTDHDLTRRLMAFLRAQPPQNH